MKRLLTLMFAVMTVLSLQSCLVKSSPNMPFVNRGDLSKDAEIVSVKVPGLLMKAFLRNEIKELKEEDPILALALKRIKTIRVMAVEGGADSENIYKRFSKYLAKNNYEEMMSIYSDGAKISINTLMKGNKIKNVLLGIIDEEDHVFVDLKTNLDLDELNQLVDYYEETNSKKDQLKEVSMK